MIKQFANYKKNELSTGGITAGENVFINKTVVFHNPQNIKIGNNVRIDYGCLLIAGKNTKIIIGDNTHINAYCAFHANTASIEIGEEVDIAIYTVFFTCSYDYKQIKPREKKFISSIKIEDNVIIGPSCVILPGVLLEKSSSIGANSLVKQNIQQNTIAAGNPSKVIKIKQ